MSEQERFEAGMKQILSVTPEELRRRIEASKALKRAEKLSEAQPKGTSENLDRS